MPRKFHSKGSAGKGMSRRRWLGMLGLGGTAALAGCLGGNGDDDGGDDDDDGGVGEEAFDLDDGLDLTQEDIPEVEGEYTYVQGNTFTTLNPLYNNENTAANAIGYTLDLGYTFTGQQEPFWLTYEMSSDDNEVWVFSLRENMEFSDPYGSVTAEDYVYQIQEIHQSDWAATPDGPDWADVHVEETGEYEFQVELESPNPLYVESLEPNLYPIPKDLVEEYVENEDQDGLEQNEELLELEFTGNLGAYVMDEWDRGSGTQYTRNDEYYLRSIPEVEDGLALFSEAPYFESLEVDIIEEQSSRIGALDTAEADRVELPPERVTEFEEHEDVDVYAQPTPYNRTMSVNMRDNGWTAGPGNLFRYKEFRQALACAISKEQIIEGILRGLAEPHFTWQPEFSTFYPEDLDLPEFGMGDMYGPEVAREKAEEAFEQSEYDYSFDGDAMITPDGDQVELELYYPPTSETNENLAEFIDNELEDNLGIDVSREGIDGTRFVEEYWNADPEGGTDTIDGEEFDWDENANANNPGPRSVTSNEAWDMHIILGFNTYPRNPLTMDGFFDGPNNTYNPPGYYPGFDAQGIFDEARQADGPDGVAEAFEDLFLNLAEEQPYIMLYFNDDIVGYTGGLKGPMENFSSGWDFPAWHFGDD